MNFLVNCTVKETMSTTIEHWAAPAFFLTHSLATITMPHFISG